MLRYCANLKAIRYESMSFNRIVTDKSHHVIAALAAVTIIFSLGEEPVKATKEASRDKFQMRFKKTYRQKARIYTNR